MASVLAEDERGRVVNLSEDEAWARFAAARVARLATIAADGTPRLVPVTFAVLASPPTGDGSAAPGLRSVTGDLGTVVTAVDHKPKRTTRLRRLDDIARDGRVSLLADEYDDDWSRLWWARADGVARVAEPPDPAHEVAARALAERYHQYRDHPPAGPAIVVTVTRWTGWSYC
ncbi:TIGR03668 family PPOX class F420-dependent oxidoreductase [Pseudofrankia sp. BMG5.37]|uniref:TIGR03668 family PPOX class F420-dependent oxidoreductase n=1 Tax=Pseudofrankia sp. BMG5.37 TaxID=3050035 RepID=UPI002895E6E8|nr:TIGR03668 family PPOX class F420-dependent oxidoreductase [Pseudofrankia sp. BMG5.37]MDT3446773.1 TIGR03668 family PPOX class F420-dependent oxidoreductase [Pseudofrankia sp. BMG5.37]